VARSGISLLLINCASMPRLALANNRARGRLAHGRRHRGGAAANAWRRTAGCWQRRCAPFCATTRKTGRRLYAICMAAATATAAKTLACCRWLRLIWAARQQHADAHIAGVAFRTPQSDVKRFLWRTRVATTAFRLCRAKKLAAWKMAWPAVALFAGRRSSGHLLLWRRRRRRITWLAAVCSIALSAEIMSTLVA